MIIMLICWKYLQSHFHFLYYVLEYLQSHCHACSKAEECPINTSDLVGYMRLDFSAF